MKGSGEKLLFVDDEENVINAFKRCLRHENYELFTAGSGFDALSILGRENINVIVCDQRMPNMSGTIFLSLVKKLYPDTVRMMLSGYSDFNELVNAVNHGDISKFVSKPWDDEDLRNQIHDAFSRQIDNKPSEVKQSEAVMITSADNIIQSINHDFCDLTQYTHTDAIGMRLMLIDQPELEENILKLVNTKGQWSGKVDSRCKDGDIMETWLSVTAIPDKQGKVQNLIHAFHQV